MNYSRCLTSTRKLAVMPDLAQWLGVEQVRPLGYLTHLRPPLANTLVVGWGIKPNTLVARDFARRYELDYCQLEDGFYCYRGHPSTDAHRLSLIADPIGIYYDGTRPSALEDLLNREDWITPELLQRAERAMQQIREHRLSKYNHHCSAELFAGLVERLADNNRQKVLLIDQVDGDMSVEFGLAGAETFRLMVEKALRENPDAEIFVKVHPDVIKGLKQGYLKKLENARITAIGEDCNPLTLLEQFDRVYTVTSQLGFEALLLGKKVTCLGMPFYAGWGLTDDRQICPRRRAKRSLAELFAAACLLYPRYLNPYTGQRCELEQVLDYLVHTQQYYKSVVKRIWCIGFSVWKRAFIHRFVLHRAEEVHFVSPQRMLSQVARGDAVLGWGRDQDHLVHTLPEGVPLWRMEDGFLRSVGLGSDLRRPASLVLDETGIYYDASQPSDLERLLQSQEFSVEELARAEHLIDGLRSSRLSKYNIGRGKLPDFRAQAHGRKLILVPGQVEDDASIRFGAKDINSNTRLLQAVRAENPEGFILYKPHPDVISRNRRGVVDESTLTTICDAVVEDVDIIDCLEIVDEIHTMTSLAGFEALLHEKAVVCYGQPFYSGWGLTLDRYPHARRERLRSLTELVAATLICYPLYLGWPEGRIFTPEGVIYRIKREKAVQECNARYEMNAWLDRRLRKLAFLLETLSIRKKMLFSRLLPYLR